MNCLYISFEYNINGLKKKKITNGILNKILNQINTFNSNSINVDFFNPYNGRIGLMNSLLKRLPFYKYIKWNNFPKEINLYQVIYIRKPWFMDGDLIKNLKKIKQLNPTVKIYLEIPTFPYDKEANKIDQIPLLLKDKIYRKKLKNFVYRIVTYSKDDLIFGIKTIKISNAININQIKPIKKYYYDPKNINLVCVSSLHYWHGYDRLITSIKEYVIKKKKISTNLILHIVGAGDEYSKIKRFIKKYNLESNIILYGSLPFSLLHLIYEKADIAVDSLGRYRSGVYFNSSLKSKEYIAKGLPVILGVDSELDNPAYNTYTFKVNNDNSPIDFNSIIEFTNNLYLNNDRKKIINDLREMALNFSFDKSLSPVITSMRES